MGTYRPEDSVHVGLPYEETRDPEADPLGLDGVDHIDIVCGNARQAVVYYATLFGFQPVAYRGPECGYPDAATYILEQNKVRLVLTTPLTPAHPLAHTQFVHGDTVFDVALAVPSAANFWREAVRRGAEPAAPPREWKDDAGVLRKAAIYTYGGVRHSLIERDQYNGLFHPGFVPFENHFNPVDPGVPVGILTVDHVVGNVRLGEMERWVKFYEEVLGFREMIHFSDQQISTEYSALMSKVLRNKNGKLKFPINEPAVGKRKSQIDEYLDYHLGPGVQHIALLTGDILKTVAELRRRGVNFLRVPHAYYEELPARVGEIKESIDQIEQLGILVDRDDDGYLLQVFTKPVEDRPTLFFEIIQRHGSQGFGVGNFKALFEAIEREQALRGNL